MREALVLIVQSGGTQALALPLPLNGPELTIGRSSESRLVLSGPEVSREHARVVATDEGLLLEDLSSKNGTFLNGRRVERSIIKVGDEIKIGGAVLRVHRLTEGELPGAPADEAFASGDRLKEEGRLAEAAACYERGLTARPEAHGRRLALGSLLESLGLWERAEEVFGAVPEGSEGRAEAEAAIARIKEKWLIYAKVRTLVMEDGPATEALLGPGESVVVEGPGWTIRYPLSADTALLKTMAKTLAAARKRLTETVGALPETIPIEVYMSSEELRRASPAPTEAFATWMAGVYDGVLRIAVGPGEIPEPPFLVLLLTHEVAHAAIDEASGGRCPAWLDEGLAQLVAQNLPRRAEARLKEAARTEALLPLMVLEAPFHRLEEKTLVDLAYAQAFSVADFLQGEVGWEGLRELLASLARGASVEEALESLGWPYSRLEAAWQASLAAQDG